MSEVLWSPAEQRDYDGFLDRLDSHLERLDVLGVNYRPPGNDELTFTGRIKQGIWNIGLRIYIWLSDND